MSSTLHPEPEGVQPLADRPPRAGKLRRSHDKERYELYEQLGSGGMGTVFRALDRELNRIVAVKVLHPELASSFRYLLQLKREVVLGSRIQSPHVVRVHDIGRWNGRPLIAMDWIDGESLFALMVRANCLPPSQVCHFAVQICQALQAIHAAGVIHRDLKPSNVLIAKNGQTLVSDFSLARSVLAADMTLSANGDNPGTPRYMAPEQLAGIPADHRSDLYSFGLVLLEMLTGTAALETLEPLRERLITSNSEKHTRSGELQKFASLNLVVRRCLQLDRNDRYGAATDVLNDLKLVESGSAPAFRPATSFRARTVSSMRNVRIRKGWLFSIAGLVLILATISWAVKHRAIDRRASIAPISATTYEGLYASAMNHMTTASGERDLRSAVQSLERVIEARPANVSAQRAHVEALMRLYELTRDDQWLDRARKATRSAGLSKEESLLFECRIDVNDRRFQKVVDNLQADWQVWKSSEEANRLLGRAFDGLGESERALPYYMEAVRLAPESWLAHNELGSALLNLGRIGDARVEFTSVIRLNPASRSGYSNRGITSLQAGDFTSARKDFETALQRVVSPETYENLGVAAYYSQQFATSVPYFEAALAMRPTSSKYAAALADALWYSGQRPAARAACGRALSLLDQLSSSRVLSIEEECRRARCLGRLGDLAGAASVLQKLPSPARDQDSAVLYSRAFLASQNHQPLAAHQWITLAVRHGYPAAFARMDPDLAMSNQPIPLVN